MTYWNSQRVQYIFARKNKYIESLGEVVTCAKKLSNHGGELRENTIFSLQKLIPRFRTPATIHTPTLPCLPSPTSWPRLCAASCRHASASSGGGGGAGGGDTTWPISERIQVRPAKAGPLRTGGGGGWCRVRTEDIATTNSSFNSAGRSWLFVYEPSFTYSFKKCRYTKSSVSLLKFPWLCVGEGEGEGRSLNLHSP